jgi:hypothetical protein
MPGKFRQGIISYVLDKAASDQLPAIAVRGLEEGLDTPSLRILAGMKASDYPSEIQHYFQRSIEELNIVLPDKRQAALEYALSIVQETLEGSKDVISGMKEIRYDAIDSYDFFSESKHYCYDSIGFEKAYGLFDTYEELSTADRPWDSVKTNQELMGDVKSQLFEELKKWKTVLEGEIG